MIRANWNYRLANKASSALLILGMVTAASDPPSPSGGETQTERQTNSTIKHEESQPEQCGTLEAPLFIQIQQPQNQHPKATETKQESEWYTRPDWWMVGATIVLVFVTGLLWMFTAFMWWISRKQFAAANRPRLDIRFVRRIADDAGRIAVEFRVENIGAGSGRVTGSNIVLISFSMETCPSQTICRAKQEFG